MSTGQVLFAHGCDSAMTLAHADWSAEDSLHVQMLRDAEPIGQMTSWLGAHGTTKHSLEDVKMPHGYVVLGDAIASLNPRFATGMTVAAMQVYRGIVCFKCRFTGELSASNAFHTLSNSEPVSEKNVQDCVYQNMT